MMSQRIKPMEPRAIEEPFDDERYLFQVKWDGVRCLAFVGSSVRLQNRRLHDRTRQYPELSSLTAITNAHECILDGEIVAFKKGKPDFPTVLKRDFAKDTKRISRMTIAVPVIYLVFDLLYVDGEPLLDRPLTERQDRLSNILAPDDKIRLVDSFPKGTSLFAAIREKELEGIVAKRRNSPYIPGKKSKFWLKVKPRKRQLCVVIGFTVRAGQIASLLLGVYDDQNQLTYVGNASAGLTYEQMKMLMEFLDKHKLPRTAKSIRGANVVMVDPILVAVVEFSEWTEGLKLRAPSLVGFSTKSPDECRI